MNPALEHPLEQSRAQERAGRLAQVRQFAQQALEMVQAHGDQEGLCGSLTHLAVAHARQGQCQEASRLASEALTLADQIPDSARAYNVLAGCAAETYDFAKAEEMFRAIDPKGTLRRIAARDKAAKGTKSAFADSFGQMRASAGRLCALVATVCNHHAERRQRVKGLLKRPDYCRADGRFGGGEQ